MLLTLLKFDLEWIEMEASYSLIRHLLHDQQTCSGLNTSESIATDEQLQTYI